MTLARVLLLAGLALMCVPAALALAVPIDAADAPVPLPDAQLPSAQLPATPQVQLPDTQRLPVGVDVSANDVRVQAGDSAAVSAEGSVAVGPASSGASFVQRAAQVAGEAAGAGVLTVAVVASASGLEGLRALLARPARLGRFLLRLLPFVPLFSRIEGQQVLDNPVRAHVHQVVVQDPGLSLEEIRSRSGIAWGTAVHHLRRLEDNGLLVSVVQNARRRYFAANTPASRCRVQVAALSHPTARRVAEYVRTSPGSDQTALCEALGVRNPTASKHLQQLVQHGLVLVERDGRRCRYHPTDALRAAFDVLATPQVPPATVQATPRVTAVPA